MFYEVLHEMPLQLAFIMFVTWIAMMVLGSGQVLFRWGVVISVLLYGIASYLRMQWFAIAMQATSLGLLLTGWGCRVHWQIKHARREKKQ